MRSTQTSTLARFERDGLPMSIPGTKRNLVSPKMVNEKAKQLVKEEESGRKRQINEWRKKQKERQQKTGATGGYI